MALAQVGDLVRLGRGNSREWTVKEVLQAPAGYLLECDGTEREVLAKEATPIPPATAALIVILPRNAKLHGGAVERMEECAESLRGVGCLVRIERPS